MMLSEREDNKALADRLRGKVVSDVQEAGKQLSAQVGKVHTVKDISAPAATPKIAQEQSDPLRERHVAEKQQQNEIGSPASQAEQKPSQSVSEKSVGAAKDKSLAESAQGLRESGVTGGRAANDVAPPKQTPAVAQRQSRRAQTIGRKDQGFRIATTSPRAARKSTGGTAYAETGQYVMFYSKKT